MWQKVYLTVLAEHRRDGTVLPRAFYWVDGQKYEIDRVRDAKPCAATKAGGHGIRYAVAINGRERYLFREGDRWFVEYDGPAFDGDGGA
jgi:hypothetical protein